MVNVLMKSPYEGSVLGAFGKSEPKPHGRVEGKRTDLVSSPSESMSPADYRLSIASLFKESPEEWEKHKDSEIVATLEKNLSSITNGFSFKVPGVKAAEELTEKCISFSTVGTYCKCKFKYFLNYVLGLQPVPEEILELSPMDAGSGSGSLRRVRACASDTKSGRLAATNTGITPARVGCRRNWRPSASSSSRPLARTSVFVGVPRRVAAWYSAC